MKKASAAKFQSGADAAMTDGFEQFKVSDELLRAYLLSNLAEPERLLLDQRLLTDDGFSQQVQVAESQLIDEYVAGELDVRTAEAFHTRFLITDARREQIWLTAALHDYTAQSPIVAPQPRQSEKRSWRGSLTEFFALKPGPAWAAAGSFALLLLVLGLAWYWSRQPRQIETPVAKQLPVNAASPGLGPSPDRVAEVATPSLPTPPTKPTPSEPPVAVASFVLLPGALRGPGEMTRVAVPRGERAILRLGLVLENPAPGAYQAELANADGKTVTVTKNLRPHRNGQSKIIFEVPARLVQPDDYQVKLSRQADGQFESVGRYYFRALPE